MTLTLYEFFKIIDYRIVIFKSNSVTLRSQTTYQFISIHFNTNKTILVSQLTYHTNMWAVLETR